MNTNNPVVWKLLPLLFYFLPFSLPALNVQITGKEASIDFRGEYNKALLYSVDFSTIGSVELNKLYTCKSGISFGAIDNGFTIHTFVQNRIGPLFGQPLYFSLAYIYNGLPAYEAHAHTLLPVASFNGRRAGINIGPGLCFTRFYGEKSIFESMLSAYVYVNFVNNERLCIGMSLGNFNDFYAGTTGSYSLSLNSLIRFDKQWSLINNIELLQSGSVALAANFYGIACRTGVRFTW